MSHVVTRTRHTLSDEDRELERYVLAKISHQRASFIGTPRQAYDAMTAFITPVADDVSIEHVDRDGVRGLWVHSGGASVGQAILFLHGGAYMLGSADGYRGLASQVAVRTNVSVFLADYALAPESPFPAAYNDGLEALRWLTAQGFNEVAIVGDSAGGGLALAILSEMATIPVTIASVVVFSPWTDLLLTGASYSDPKTHDPVFQRSLIASAASTYLSGADAADGRASPLYAVPQMLPPLAIQVGTDEFLLDDSTRYATAAGAKGGEVRLDIYEGMHHVFQRCVQDLPQARLALDAAAAFIDDHW